MKTAATDGYNAVQVGYDVGARTKSPSPSRPLQKGRAALRHLEEFRLRDEPTYEVGAQINVSELFKEGDKVDVRGKSIGKGFQGAAKRARVFSRFDDARFQVAPSRFDRLRHEPG